MSFVEEIEQEIEGEIVRREETGKLLAAKFPELAGLSWTEFLVRCPIRLDFVTANIMYGALNQREE